MSTQLVDAHLLARPQYHPRLDCLALILIRHAGHADFGHGLVRRQHFLHLARPDLEAAGLDEVLLAVNDKEVAFCVHVAKVACIDPTVADHFRRGAGALPIADHDLRRADADLAKLPDLQRALACFKIDNAHINIGHGQTD